MIRSKLFNQEQIDFIVKNYKGIPFKELTKKFNTKFNTNFEVKQIQRFCGNNKLHNGIIGGRFEKGHQPWNKGTKGLCKANRTSFKKGQLNGRAKQLYKPVGSERLDKDGYLLIKVKDPNVWKLKHRVIWEEKHGKIPSKHCLMFLDGNKQNCSLENLVLVKRKDLVRFNQLRLPNNDPNITKVGLQVVEIKNQIVKRKKRGDTTWHQEEC